VLRRWQCGDGDGLMLPVARSDRGVRSVALAASRLYVGDVWSELAGEEVEGRLRARE
jgi:hypothetical protein